MSILSIDVGLKNLAMCIMDSDTIIHLWNVYNVFPEPLVCKSLTKTKKICMKKASLSCNSVGYCKTHSPKDSKVTIIKEKKIKSYTYNELANNVINKLKEVTDSNNCFKTVDKVLIELQPKINQKMKFVSHIIFGFFVQYGTKSVCFVRASQKLKGLDKSLTNTYRNRKETSVNCTKKFLLENNMTQWANYLDSFSKKDDLCDVFLMCISKKNFNKII
jgi:hypothetical protein